MRCAKDKFTRWIARTTEKHTEGPVAEVILSPPEKLTLDPKFSKFIPNYVPVSNIKGAFNVDHTVPGEERIQIDEAVVCTSDST